MTPPACPLCRRTVIRLQRSAPKGAPAAAGPVAAYPCGCWLTARQAQRIADIAAVNAIVREETAE